jgi:hypothetical protein
MVMWIEFNWLRIGLQAWLRAARSWFGWFDSRWGLKTFLFSAASKPALGPTASYSMCTGTLSLRVMRPGREVDHSPPSSAKVKECVTLYLHPQHVFLAWCLVKAQGPLYLYLIRMRLNGEFLLEVMAFQKVALEDRLVRC